MSQWLDLRRPPGILLRIIDCACLMLFIFLTYASIKIIIFYSPRVTDQIIALFACIFFSLLFIHRVFGVKYCGTTFKEVTLISKGVRATNYYGKVITIYFNEVAHIHHYKRNIIMNSLNLFHGDKKGYEINLKNKKTYYLTPLLSELDSLKQVLHDGINQG
jgi:ABC-type transport system involved in multi-copper enzyme maturation permease subunit